MKRKFKSFESEVRETKTKYARQGLHGSNRMQAEMGALGHRKGGKIETKGDQNAPKIEPKGCQKPPRYLLDDILRKTGNSDVEMVEIMPQAGAENGRKNLIRALFRHPVGPKER